MLLHSLKFDEELELQLLKQLMARHTHTHIYMSEPRTPEHINTLLDGTKLFAN